MLLTHHRHLTLLYFTDVFFFSLLFSYLQTVRGLEGAGGENPGPHIEGIVANILMDTYRQGLCRFLARAGGGGGVFDTVGRS